MAFNTWGINNLKEKNGQICLMLMAFLRFLRWAVVILCAFPPAKIIKDNTCLQVRVT